MASHSYAVFLSYDGDDHDTVEKIAVYLDDNAKLHPWFDRWELIPGEPWVRNLERGLAASASCAVMVGKRGEGPWQQAEVEAALRQQVQNGNFRVIPVLLPQAPKQPELPTFLSGNMWVDLRGGLDDDNALWRLECGIRGVPPGRGRPQPLPARQAPSTTATDSISIDPVDVQITMAERPAYVFISYRHQEPDNALAQAFANALRQAGHQVFIDTGIRWGANWVKEIRESLERSDYLLVLLSPVAAESEMLIEEVAIASDLAHQRNGTPLILPIRVRFPFSESLPYRLSAYLRDIQQEFWNEPCDSSRLVSRLLGTIAERTSWPAEAPGVTPAVSARQIAPQPYFDPRDLIIPGGALDVESRFYIMREADEVVFKAVHGARAMITVRGPRQTGKTSLIMRIYATVRRVASQLRPVFVDFQALPREDFYSLDSIWRAIAVHIAEQLRLAEWGSTHWRVEASHDRNFSGFLDHFVFAEDETSLLICLDEVDRVFNSPIKSQFFPSVRAFYNRAAIDPSWKKVRWVLGTSSEPRFFIEDLTQSPFNIGLRVELSSFTPEEVAEFARRHGLTLNQATLDAIMDYVGGRPYLVHLLLYLLASNWGDRDQLFDAQTAGNGIFRDHLHHYLMQFQQEKALAQAMKMITNGQTCRDIKMVNRLEAAGLVHRDEHQKIVPLCRLYAEFFRNELN